MPFLLYYVVISYMSDSGCMPACMYVSAVYLANKFHIGLSCYIVLLIILHAV